MHKADGTARGCFICKSGAKLARAEKMCVPGGGVQLVGMQLAGVDYSRVFGYQKRGDHLDIPIK